MNLAIDVLRRFVDIPDDPRALRDLLDDLGLEVKRFDGQVFTLELLANRGDHHCYDGVAREIFVRYGGRFDLPQRADLEVGESPWAVDVDPELCPVYTATLLVRREGPEGALGSAEQRVLDAAGIHAIRLPVDASNLANLELGQPTHAFDADTLRGPVRVRRSLAGERAWPLFQAEPVPLPEGTIVVADDEKVLAIAGVIGCEESKTTADTRRILLESAHFDPVAVRRASRALGIATDSSARFERGSDPSRPLVGAGRVVWLLEAFGPWARAGATGLFGGWTDPGREILLDPAATAAFLALDLDAERIAGYLRRGGFGVSAAGNSLAVRVPPHRLFDVEFAADLYEELARAVGYNVSPTRLPPVDRGAIPSEAERRRAIIDEVLVGQGFYEVVTDGFHSRGLRDRLGIGEGHPLWAHVETTNALDRGCSLLRNECVGQAVEAVAANLRVRNPDVRAFEWTTTFHPLPPADPPDRARPPCEERAALWAIACGTDRSRGWEDRSRPADAWFLKGVVEELAVALDLELTTGPVPEAEPLRDLLHPGRRAAVLLGGRHIGVIGEVHPAICQAFKLKKARPSYLGIEAGTLLSAPTRRRTYAEPPARQPIDRSLAFGLPPRVEAGAVGAALAEAGPDWLDHVEVTDLFAYDEAGVPMRAVTFDLVFSAAEGDRTSEEVNAVLATLVAAIDARFGPRGVRLRG